ncbi:LPXTG cell wall anchor domain-containing protein [Effusibacillus lacus]|nr:LPXTG-motif cell wall-anchored protein [Effusibacillus lacus]
MNVYLLIGLGVLLLLGVIFIFFRKQKYKKVPFYRSKKD